MTICFILGTRPEIIKLSPLITYCQENRITHFIIHTKQHYSRELDYCFFENLGIRKPKYNLDVGSESHGKQTGRMMIKIERVLEQDRPNIVLVQGDTNSVLAGALVASKMRILLGHVEAGLRSFDRNMPEELNRTLTDHCSDLFFAPTPTAVRLLKREGIENEVYLTGNTIVDALKQCLNIAEKKQKIKKALSLEKKKFFLVTAHRQENTDNKERLRNILKALEMIHQKYGLRVIYAIHPRTRKMIRQFRLKKPENVEFIKPVDYFDFLWLEANARLVLTDSGGVQEESCTLNVPCVTLRENTERPETVEEGANIVAGLIPKNILKAVDKMLMRKAKWKNPFGDGKSGERIIKICLKKLK